MEWVRTREKSTECEKDPICDMLYDHLDPGATITLQGSYSHSDSKLAIEIKIANEIKFFEGKLKFTDATFFIDITFGKEFAVLIGITASFVYHAPESEWFTQKLKIKGMLSISTEGELEASFDMNGEEALKNVFGIKQLQISRLILEASIGFKTKRGSFGLETNLKLVHPERKTNNIQSITMRGKFEINQMSPWLSNIHVSVDRFTLGHIGDVFDLDIPEFMRDYGFTDVELSYASSGFTLADGTEIGIGLVFKAKFRLWNLSGDAKIVLNAADGIIDIDVKMDPIKILGGTVLSITDSKGDVETGTNTEGQVVATGGPKFVFYFNKESLFESHIEIDGKVSILGEEMSSTRVLVNRNGLQLDLVMRNLFFLHVMYDQPTSFFEIKIGLVEGTSLKQILKEKMKKYLLSGLTFLTESVSTVNEFDETWSKYSEEKIKNKESVVAEVLDDSNQMTVDMVPLLEYSFIKSTARCMKGCLTQCTRSISQGSWSAFYYCATVIHCAGGCVIENIYKAMEVKLFAAAHFVIDAYTLVTEYAVNKMRIFMRTVEEKLKQAKTWMNEKIDAFFEWLDVDIVVNKMELSGQVNPAALNSEQQLSLLLTGEIDVEASFLGETYSIDKSFEISVNKLSGDEILKNIGNNLGADLREKNEDFPTEEVMEEAEVLNGNVERFKEECDQIKVEWDEKEQEAEVARLEVRQAKVEFDEQLPKMTQAVYENEESKRSSICKRFNETISHLHEIKNLVDVNSNNNNNEFLNDSRSNQVLQFNKENQHVPRSKMEHINGVLLDTLNEMRHAGISKENLVHSRLITQNIKRNLIAILNRDQPIKRSGYHEGVTQHINKLRSYVPRCKKG